MVGQDKSTDQRAALVALVPRLRRFALTLTGNVADADDLVQIALEKALRSLSSYDEQKELHSWVFRIMQNAFIDTQRQVARRPEDEDVTALSDRLGDPRQTDAEERVFVQQVGNAVAALPAPQRLVVSYVLVEGLSYKEAAAQLGIPVGTVMSRLARARLALEEAVFGEAITP